MGHLDGRAALITGASGGMGRATAVEFAKEGARAIGLQYGRNREAARSVAKAVADLGAEPLVIRADVTRQESARAMVRTFVRRFERLDAVACFAGYPFRREEWFRDFPRLAEATIFSPLHFELLGSVVTARASAGSGRTHAPSPGRERAANHPSLRNG